MENLWLRLLFWLGPYGKADVEAGFQAVNSNSNYKNLCTLLYIQGVADSIPLEQQEALEELREQLTRNREEGWYATGLP